MWPGCLRREARRVRRVFSELGSSWSPKKLNPGWAESWRGADLLSVFAARLLWSQAAEGCCFFSRASAEPTFPARRIGRPPRTHWASCALRGGPKGQAGRLGFFQTPESLFLSWKDQECNITSMVLELFLRGHFRCFKFQISLPGQEELKQPTARLLSPALDSVSPQPPA